MLILGVESSCDETAFSVVEDGRRVLSNEVASQVEIHARFGGVVPEIASRAHLEACVPLYRKALADAGVDIANIDGIAVTRGPGLAGCLLVGMEFAKALALRHGKPLYNVHHIAGHLYSVYIGKTTDGWGQDINIIDWEEFAPYLALVVSGGHTSLVHVHAPLEYQTLGETMDDAVGEAYDKVAKIMGLGYPGGPEIDRLAQTGNPRAFDFPRPILSKDNFDFSFSGLKTAVARIVEKENVRGNPTLIADVAASFQAACIEVLLTKARRALELTGLERLAITGGVACNRGLRNEATRQLPGVKIAFPAVEYCGDNAAMIAGLGYHVAKAGMSSALDSNAAPSLPLAGSSEGWKF